MAFKGLGEPPGAAVGRYRGLDGLDGRGIGGTRLWQAEALIEIQAIAVASGQG